MWFWTVETNYEKEIEREIEFEVSDTWFGNWFIKNRLNKETRGNIESSTYKIEQDFLNDWILDDSVEMYSDAIKENAILETNVLTKWENI